MKVLYRGKPYKVYGTHTKHTGRDLANVEGGSSCIVLNIYR